MHRAQSAEDYLVYLKHLALYKFVSSYTTRKRALDLGCGEGYGSDALAHTAHFIVATDRDVAAVMHARQKYARGNLGFVACDAQFLPFRAESFETVVSFEVIEHIPSVRKYLEEIKRVTTGTGVVIISTPNRILRLLPFQKPWNRFHLREYAARDLKRTVSAIFTQVQVCGITATSTILEIEKRRVRQNPLIAYPKMIARIVLPRAVYAWLKQIRARLFRPVAAPPPDFDPAQFSVDHFRIAEGDWRECINLIAISANQVTR
jgi:2-polyprenyl-3-methyl-5-hydroxy-6-metoxy-1,4-benzoquinol methylase